MIKQHRSTDQLLKYFGAALVGYAFDFGTLVVLHEIFHVYYLFAATCGFILGLIVVYILSSKFVFGDSKIKSKTTEFIVFTIIGLIGLGILNLLMWLMTDFVHVNYLLSKIVATVFVYAWNFFARKSLYHN